MKLPTPLYDLKEYCSVYEPREDTFLLLDALESEIDHLKELSPTLALEIGSGSGIVISSLSFIFGCKCNYLAVDINPEACLATMSTAKLNNCIVETVNMNLTDGLKGNMFDLLLFNPPYVLTDSEEYNEHVINKAWAGGCEGRETIDKFLNTLPGILSDKGLCYLLLLKENKPNEISDYISRNGLNSKIIIERKIIGEHLIVMKIFR